ncbi:MAG: FAD-dependent oxidoreductase [Thermoplasmata archaeon]|nr:FAD-dependent oxidoreductase [Thermoplasmata archaeon]
MLPIAGAPPTLPKPQRVILPLLAKRRESPTVMTFDFATQDSGFHYLSNQAVRLSLPGVDDPWGAVRSFSLSSSPTETDRISVTCKITDTPFKQALSRLETGAPAEVYGPLGSFLFDGSRPSVFIAGGIGISPFRGMLKFASDTGDTSPKRLLYSARVPEELVFRNELDEFARASPQVQVHYTVTRPAESTTPWGGRVGRIDAEWIRTVAGSLGRPLYYVVGLPEMVSEILTMLGGPLGVLEGDVDYEMFRGY